MSKALTGQAVAWIGSGRELVFDLTPLTPFPAREGGMLWMGKTLALIGSQ